MSGWEIIKAIGVPVIVGLILFAANKFYSAVVLLINHEIKLKDLHDAVTINIPLKIDNLNQEVTKAQEVALDTFTSEFKPLKEDVKEIKIDIFNLKKHTNFPEDGRKR